MLAFHLFSLAPVPSPLAAARIYGVAEAIGPGSNDVTGNSVGLLADVAKIFIDTLTYVPEDEGKRDQA